jgi:hypothetical protein
VFTTAQLAEFTSMALELDRIAARAQMKLRFRMLSRQTRAYRKAFSASRRAGLSRHESTAVARSFSPDLVEA